jgi:hypothetical protein
MPSTDITSGREHVLSPLCKQWLRKIKDAKKIKWERFGQYAVEGMKFYDAAHDWMWKEEYAKRNGGFLEKDSGASLPTFRMQVNRIFEAVALFGPALYHRNPDITVTPVKQPNIPPELLGLDPQDPQAQQVIQQLSMREQLMQSQRTGKAGLKQHYLNWLQVEGDKKTHARRSITEAIIKGMGTLWTDVFQPRGSDVKYPWSYHISIDDIIVDPDAEYWEDVQWIARYCCHPVNLVERTFGLPDRSLKGHMQSMNAQGDIYGSRKETSQKRRHGRSFDLIEYWQVYSKNGFGDRLRKTSDSVSSKFDFEPFGDFCKIVVAENIPYPLNMPTEAIKTEDIEQLFERAQWEVPYWEGGGWPCTFLSFYDKPRCVWPVSIVKAAVGELRFVNWCMSFLADKVAASCTTYVAVAKQAGMEIQNQIQNGMAPYTVLEISSLTGRSISDVVSFLDSPNFSSDIWKMLSEVLALIDKRTGLTDLIYGMTDSQLRSATEANIKEQNTNIRPDDMASRVEDFLSETAVNEIACAVWTCEGKDVVGPLGDLGASVWDNHIKTQDFAKVIHDFDYRIAAGTARKPNKNTKQRALSELGQVILPTIQQFATQGVVEPWNAYMSEVGTALDLDVSGFLLEASQDEGPSPEEQMAQLEMQKMQVELQIKQAEFQMKQQAVQAELQMKQQAAMTELQLKQQDKYMEMSAEQEKVGVELLMEREKGVQELQQGAQQHSQEMQQNAQLNQQQLIMERARLALLTKENEIKLQGLKAMNDAKVAAARAQARVAASKPKSESSS